LQCLFTRILLALYYCIRLSENCNFLSPPTFSTNVDAGFDSNNGRKAKYPPRVCDLLSESVASTNVQGLILMNTNRSIILHAILIGSTTFTVSETMEHCPAARLFLECKRIAHLCT